MSQLLVNPISSRPPFYNAGRGALGEPDVQVPRSERLLFRADVLAPIGRVQRDGRTDQGQVRRGCPGERRDPGEFGPLATGSSRTGGQQSSLPERTGGAHDGQSARDAEPGQEGLGRVEQCPEHSLVGGSVQIEQEGAHLPAKVPGLLLRRTVGPR